VATEQRKEDALGEILKAFENPNDIEKIEPQPESSQDSPLDPKLLTYIKAASKRGQAFDSIRKDLLRGGHANSKIDKHIEFIELERRKLVHQTWFQVMIALFILALAGAVALLVLNSY